MQGRNVGSVRLALALAALALAVAPVVADQRPQDGGQALREALRARLEAMRDGAGLDVARERVHTVATASRFYEARGFQPIWIAGGAPTPAAARLLEALQEVETHGLDPRAYHVGPIARRLAAWGSAAGPAGIGAAVDTELLLTDGFLLCGAHLLSGRVDARSIDSEWIAAPRARDLLPALVAVAAGDDPAGVLRSLAPPQPGYERLRGALAGLRRIAAAGGWAPIGDGPALREGARDERVTRLRRRLQVTGDAPLTFATDDDLFDVDLADGVRSFQARHGLDADGVVGRRTLAELDTPVGDRITQLRVNLERWRWLPEDLGRRHLRVNIAAFDLVAMADGRPELSMRVIVGRPYRRTPVFSDRMSYLVLNPSWNVPMKLAVEDKLPEIRKDPGYLVAQGITVLSGWGADARVVDPGSVDWTSLGRGNFPYRLRQEPGPLNALGRIKFMFPNPFDVYLHDTPSRGLFSKTDRDFSSGCIRLEQPLQLALWVLAPDSGWTRERLETALATGREQTVRLPEPVPVHLEYWTAWVDEDGTEQFRRDLYGRDSRVAAALDEAPPGADGTGEGGTDA